MSYDHKNSNSSLAKLRVALILNPPKIQTRFNKIHSTPLLITKKKKKNPNPEKRKTQKIEKVKDRNKEQRKKTIPSFTIPAVSPMGLFPHKRKLTQRERGKRQKGTVQS